VKALLCRQCCCCCFSFCLCASCKEAGGFLE
jgi:hypothetical protein